MLVAVQADLVLAIQNAGFDATPLSKGDTATLLLTVSGMMCAACAVAVEEALASRQGVAEARVSLLTGRAEVSL